MTYTIYSQTMHPHQTHPDSNLTLYTTSLRNNEFPTTKPTDGTRQKNNVKQVKLKTWKLKIWVWPPYELWRLNHSLTHSLPVLKGLTANLVVHNSNSMPSLSRYLRHVWGASYSLTEAGKSWSKQVMKKMSFTWSYYMEQAASNMCGHCSWEKENLRKGFHSFAYMCNVQIAGSCTIIMSQLLIWSAHLWILNSNLLWPWIAMCNCELKDTTVGTNATYRENQNGFSFVRGAIQE